MHGDRDRILWESNRAKTTTLTEQRNTFSSSAKHNLLICVNVDNSGFCVSRFI